MLRYVCEPGSEKRALERSLVLLPLLGEVFGDESSIPATIFQFCVWDASAVIICRNHGNKSMYSVTTELLSVVKMTQPIVAGVRL